MPSNRLINIGPVALTTTLTTNILNPGVTSLAGVTGFTMLQPYIILRHIRILNKTAAAAAFSLWKGATGGNVAGTEFLGTAYQVPANQAFDAFGVWRFDSADFLVGGASVATALTFYAEGEIGVSG